MEVKNNKKKKIFITIGAFIILSIIFSFYFYFDLMSTNNKKVNFKDSIMTMQKGREKDFKTKGYTIDNPNVILDPYNNSPLTALVMFETKSEVAPTVIITGKDENSTFKHTFKKGKKHYVEVLGLYPDFNNKIIINYKEKDNIISKELFIQTDKLPKGFILPTSVDANKDMLNNDLYFFSPSGLNRACAYDVNGDVRWYLSNIALWDNTRLKNGHLLVGTERLVNLPYYVSGLYEMDMMGKVYNEFSLPGGYHHDYFELPGGNLLVLTNDFNNKYGTVEDFIVELDRNTGEIVKTFDLKNIIDMDDGKSNDWSSYDWFHNNSIWYDEKTNSITLSGRHKDAVINIGYSTGKLNWIIGDKTNWREGYHKYFFTPVGDEEFEWQWSQHAAMITPEGYVFILDNGNNKSKIKKNYVDAKDSYTRGVLYKIDTLNMTIEQIYQYGKERGSDFYSPYISDVDYINSTHFIVHSGGIVYDEEGNISNVPAGFVKNPTLVSDTVEILNGKVVFEIKLPTNNYRVEKQSLYSSSDLELGKASKLGTLGKTKVNESILGFVKGEDSDEIFKKYNISINKEDDRLVFTGKFKKEDDVNIVLYRNFISSYYKVDVSKKPYTALCVDLFTEEEKKYGIMISKYINDVGLYGDYSIYLEINGKMYDTDLSVIF